MVRKFVACLVTVVGLCCVLAGSAFAGFGFSSVSFSAIEAPAGTVEHPGEPWSEGEPLGAADVQAGSHPWAVRTSFVLNSSGPEGSELPVGDVKDVLVQLPAGLVGNATILSQCSIKQFETPPLFEPPLGGFSLGGASCPVSTQVGTADFRFGLGGPLTDYYFNVYNLVPPPGSPAQFGVSPLRIPVLLRPTARTEGDYGLTVAAENISQFEKIGGSTFTFWGTPADPSHDALRGECLGAGGETLQTAPHDVGHKCTVDAPRTPFLTMPVSCAMAGLGVVFLADSWQNPAGRNPDGTPDLSDPNWARAEARLPALGGCDRPAFKPSLTASADTTSADTPAGLTVEVKSSQDGLVNATGVAAAAISEALVALPVGFSINPGQAAGLVTCQPAQSGLGSEAPESCPRASRVGVVQIASPLLPDKLVGNAYVLQSNPPNLQLLIAASADGVNVKLLAHVTLNESTGQIVTTLSGLPPLPVSDFSVSFSGGAQAALVTPPKCGTYRTEALFTPSSAPFSPGFPDLSSFAVTTGPAGGGCTSPLPFSPVMSAGGSTDQAGAFTNFSVLLDRADGQQRISGLRFTTPPGLLARLGQVTLCPEPEASLGTCPASSQIGHTIVTAGPGPNPLLIPEPGQPPAPIYLTGGYRGASYGLSIVVPVIAGPFNLGTQVVRGQVAVDSRTLQLTITTDPSGAYAIPAIVRGVPADLRKIDAVIDRPGFMLNPTNCSPLTFTGTATSSEAATSGLSSAFRVGSCQTLAFVPKFSVSTAGRTSRKNGASLTARLTYPQPPAGIAQATLQANISSLKLDLPRQLPARLTTLEKACVSTVFETNPAACPVASLIGHATVHTPLLPVPLTGPMYFVSHGSEAFPNLVIVLQGYGVTVNVVGSTFINKASVLSSTFKNIPDASFTSFEVTLPQGPYSALTANGDLCSSKLQLPNAFNAQNGLIIHQTTRVKVTNCPKTKKNKKKRTKAKKANQQAQNGNGRKQ